MATRHRMFQTSLISSLAQGVFEDDMTLRELLNEGSFGLGTFNQLDGEMIVLDGVCHQLRSDGSVQRPPLDTRTPFAMVTNFVPTLRREVQGPLDRKGLDAVIDDMLVSDNYACALRITGDFAHVETRTVERQQGGHRTLAEATEDEAVVRFDDVRGTIGGFRTPMYEAAIAVAGTHEHFLDDQQSRGGHLIDFELRHATVEICVCTDLVLRLPLTRAFQDADLATDDLQEQVQQAEHTG